MRRHRYEHRLRARVKRERACLSTLDPTTRSLLGLRAGLSGPAQTRSQAASQLGLTRGRATRLEHAGLRELHAACGSAGGGGAASGPVPARVAALADGAPTLEPANYLPVASAPQLQPAVDVQHPRGRGAVKGVTASSSPGARTSGRRAVPATVEASALAGEGSGPDGLWIAVAAMIAALVALMLVGLRRRAVAMQRSGPRAAAAPPAHAPQPAQPPAASTAAMMAAQAEATAPSAAAAPVLVEPSEPEPVGRDEELPVAEADDVPAPVAAAPAPVTRMRPRDPRRLAYIAARELKKRRGR